MSFLKFRKANNLDSLIEIKNQDSSGIITSEIIDASNLNVTNKLIVGDDASFNNLEISGNLFIKNEEINSAELSVWREIAGSQNIYYKGNVSIGKNLETDSLASDTKLDISGNVNIQGNTSHMFHSSQVSHAMPIVP